MAALKVLASISLIAFAITVQPALAANDGQPNDSAPGIGSPAAAPSGSSTPHARPKLTPEQRAARRARREARHQARMQSQGSAPN